MPIGHKIVVGVPTWCEAATIQDHVGRIDRALAAAGFRADDAVIVNADNQSPDGTAELFMRTPTSFQKVPLATAGRGKGRNCAALLDYATTVGVKALVTLDADLEVLPDNWLPAMLQPVLNDETDLVAPLYSRYWYDANQTNQVSAPVLLAMTGHAVRQPIGGDFAFSARALRHLQETPWPEVALGFGWDAFVVTAVMLADLKLHQAPLSVGKIHSWRSGSADEIEEEMQLKFFEPTSALFDQVARFALPLDEPLPDYPQSPPLGLPPKDYQVGPIHEFAQRCWARDRSSQAVAVLGGDLELGGPRLPVLDDDRWGSVLARGVLRARHGAADRELYRVLQTLFFARLATVLGGYARFSPPEIDTIVHGVGAVVRQQIAKLGNDHEPA